MDPAEKFMLNIDNLILLIQWLKERKYIVFLAVSSNYIQHSPPPQKKDSDLSANTKSAICAVPPALITTAIT
jgi:hypothetical protein